MSEPPKRAMPNFFNQEMADHYDERNSKLVPITDNLHFLIRHVMADLPDRARILCVGVGTGADILSLARANPHWTFVGVDPSAEMLAVCRRRLQAAGLLDRCELLVGVVQDVPQPGGFDAVVSLLVAHFIRREERQNFYKAIHDQLRPGGLFVSAEISVDLNGGEFPTMLRDWKQVQTLMGVTPDALEKLDDGLRNVLGVLSPAETENLWRQSGFGLPIPFFQAFLIRGWHAFRR